MSGGMGYYVGDLGDDGFQDLDNEPQGQPAQQGSKNPLREHLKKVEARNLDLEKQVQQLFAYQRETQIADALQAKGYDRAVAKLYGGEPEKLDEWLTGVAPLLASQPAPTSGEGANQAQGQPPASTVPADGQAAMQQMQQAGQFSAPPAGSDAEQVAAMNAITDPAKLMEYLQSQGNPHYFNG